MVFVSCEIDRRMSIVDSYNYKGRNGVMFEYCRCGFLKRKFLSVVDFRVRKDGESVR